MSQITNSLQYRILTKLRSYFHRDLTRAEAVGMKWEDYDFLRESIIRMERGDRTVWANFISRLKACRTRRYAVQIMLREVELIEFDKHRERMVFTSDAPDDHDEQCRSFLKLLTTSFTFDGTGANPRPTKVRASRQRVMYIEQKPGLAGHARIGRVLFSKSGRTIYYTGHRLQSLDGRGYKANYFNVDSGLEYWITGCRKDGRDTLYPATVEIDEDIREQYWLEIRNRPDCISQTSYRCPGKYSKRQPC